MANLVVKVAAISVAMWICTGDYLISGEEVTPEVNKLAKYLNDSMTKYSSWLSDNHLDPSPVVDKQVLHFKPSGKVELDCFLKNQQVSGHSKSKVNKVEANVSFTEREYVISHYMRYPAIKLYGDFDCVVRIKSENYTELNGTDLYISGEGQYAINMSNVRETLGVYNLGINDNYTFDIFHKHIYMRYGLYVYDYEANFENNVWNDSLVSDYIDDIASDFFMGYRHMLADDQPVKIIDHNPLFRLILKYAEFLLKKLDLRTIFDPSELPETYVATPTPEPDVESTTEPTAYTIRLPAKSIYLPDDS